MPAVRATIASRSRLSAKNADLDIYVSAWWPPREESLAGSAISRRHSFNLGRDHCHRQWAGSPQVIWVLSSHYFKKISLRRAPKSKL
jgi:hypothetical protein